MITTIEDIRSAKICMKGARKWCGNNNIDWSNFCANGIDSNLLEKYDDALIKAILEQTRIRVSKGVHQ